MPPSVLFGMGKSDTASTAHTKHPGQANSAFSMNAGVKLPKMASAQNLNNIHSSDLPPKSRGSYSTSRTGPRGILNNKFGKNKNHLSTNNRTGGTLGFSNMDIGSVGMNADKIMKLNNVLELDKKFTMVDRKYKVANRA